MHTKPHPHIKNALTSTELTILKSFALGLGCEATQSLLEISAQKYQELSQSVFNKLNTCNAYMAVQVAFQTGILPVKEYVMENVKSFALEFALEEHGRFHHLQEMKDKQTLWELYDVLLEFHVRVTSHFLSHYKSLK